MSIASKTIAESTSLSKPISFVKILPFFKSPIDNNSLNFIIFSFFPLMDKNYTIFLELCPMKTLSRFDTIAL